MDLNSLAIFVAVVEAGSLTGAASRLNMPKSKVSRRLAQFEAQQEVRLLTRTTRSIRLTEPGKKLYARAQPLLYELEQLEGSLARSQSVAAGMLSLKTPSDFFPNQFADICLEFLDQHPNVDLSIGQFSGSMPQGINDSDISFVLHQGALPDSFLNAKPLMSMQQSLYGSPHRYARDQLLSSEVGSEQCLLEPGENTWLFANKGSLEAVRVSGRMAVSNQSMLIEACVAGLGIAKLADVDVETQLRNGALIKLLTPVPVEALSLTLLFRSEFLPVRARLFIDFFQSQLGRLSSRLVSK